MNQPKPLHHQCAILVIKQVADLNCACRVCGMCKCVCSNNAIRAMRNPNNRRNLLSNRLIKHGGRTNLNAQHTFDILSPKELSFEVVDGKLVANKKNPPVRMSSGEDGMSVKIMEFD